MRTTLLGCTASVAMILGTAASAQDMPPFGDDDSVAYAAQLWAAMGEAKLVGDGMIRSTPYEGLAPHGLMLETFYTDMTIGGHNGALVVKRNYGPEGVEAGAVLMDPDKHLGAITVMFKREAGYDDDNANWFWAKYLPDGSLDKNPKGMQLAGRVAKGADKGCIACHSSADGDDYLFTADHIK
ncbi:MAG: cytochrome P460 family protein [Rhodobacteraceae bacterium]|nr:cytochrome P460 family protein [Paracoccaceae bacterium]